jgi:hypothetical protein
MLMSLRCDVVKASGEFYASLGFGAGARGDEGGGRSFRRLDDDQCDFLTHANDDSVRGGGDGVGGCFPRVEVDTDS